MNKNNAESNKARTSLFISRLLVYLFLAFLTVLCLFSFYLLIINSSHSNGQLQGGFTMIPGGHFLDNLKNAWNDASIDIPRGMLNSFVVALISALLTTYFSALTAYGLHAYNFRFKKVAFTFILAIMFILLAILPVMIVYIFLSKYIIKGVTAGSVKG